MMKIIGVVELEEAYRWPTVTLPRKGRRLKKKAVALLRAYDGGDCCALMVGDGIDTIDAANPVGLHTLLGWQL